LAKRKYDFDEAVKVKVLLWSDRHCCLCGKQSGIGIEIAHLDPHSSDPDNAIPLCFDCHAAVGHYNREHPRGRKYSIPELKAGRERVYEEHTRHLVPPVLYSLQQKGRSLPNVGFRIANLGNTYPVKAKVRIKLAQGKSVLGVPASGHYDGSYLWNLNPRLIVNGHFTAPGYNVSSTDSLRARIDITLLDIYERPHVLLPVGYVINNGTGNDWYLEPSEEALAISF